MTTSQNQKTNRRHKDTFFRTLFGDSKNFLELYNAVANENLPDETEVTLYPSNELLAKFNDLAASIEDRLIVFFEHQSSFSPNMPLRILSYVNDILYLHIVDKDKLYGKEQVKIPTPKFFVIYNGEQKLNVQELKLSDAFIARDSEPSMEMTVKIVDVNPGKGDIILSRSEKLKGYSHLIEEIRNNQRTGMTRDKAIATAIKSCLEKDILKDFLTKYYSEVLDMLNWEYDADAHMRVLAQEARQEGRKEGRQEGAVLLAKLLEDGMSLEDALKQITERESDSPLQ